MEIKRKKYGIYLFSAYLCSVWASWSVSCTGCYIHYKLAHNKQTIFLIVIALVFSPIIIGIRYCLFTMGKLEDKRFKIVIQTVGFILFAFYLISLKDNVAYLLIFITSFIYLTYQYYMFSLEND